MLATIVAGLYGLGFNPSAISPQSKSDPAFTEVQRSGSLGATIDRTKGNSSILAPAEQLLLDATQSLVAGALDDAEATLQQVIREEPHFRLAHALLADIQQVRRGGLPSIPTDGSSQANAWLDEWTRRIQALDHLPSEHQWPASMLGGWPGSRHVFLVDAQTLRLYWYEHDVHSESPPKLKASFYISVGKAGVGKEYEGDNKTPLGVYRIVARRERSELPAFYGAGALVLDYPNTVDRQLGRTGHGIWLHGSPPDTYTRDPYASEGCVVLSNRDMEHLLQFNDVVGAPVIIVSSLQWIDQKRWYEHRSQAIQIIRDWAKSTHHLDLDPRNLGVQRWRDTNGQIYWRVDYVATDQTQARYHWFLRESEDGLIQLGGPVVAQTRPAASGQTNNRDKQQAKNSNDNASQATAVEHAILQSVRSWAQAWSARDIDRYLSHYHPHYAPPGMRRADWLTQRRERITSKQHIRIEVQQPRVRLRNKTAEVTFIQIYQADGKVLRARKTLVLATQQGRWLIVEEKA